MLTALIILALIALALAERLRRRNQEAMRLLEYTEGYGANPDAAARGKLT